MLLQLSTWPEVESYLERSRGIIIPIGSTEQHGPIGLIGTDALCAEAIAKGVGEAAAAMVAPTLNVGMALHHTAFPGTISLRPSTLIAVVLDYVTCLARSGFDRFFFINGHGGNIATLKAAFSETYYHLESIDREVKCQVGNWFACRSVYQLAKELYGDKEGSHATPSEVALTWYLYPDFIKKAPMSETVASGYPIYGSRDFREHYPDGRMGSRPDLATPEHGRRFYEVAVKELSEAYLQFIG